MPKNKFLSRATAIVVIGPRQIGKPMINVFRFLDSCSTSLMLKLKSSEVEFIRPYQLCSRKFFFLLWAYFMHV